MRRAILHSLQSALMDLVYQFREPDSLESVVPIPAVIGFTMACGYACESFAY